MTIVRELSYTGKLSTHALRNNTEGRQQLVELGLWTPEQAESRRKQLTKAGSKSSAGEFIGWDGEGVTSRGRHRYVMLCNSHGNYITNPKGIATERALNFLCDEAKSNPRANHVCYGASYDVNMIMGDLGSHQVARLAWDGLIYWNSFRIEYRPRKCLQVTRYNGPKRRSEYKDVTITLWDVIGFFQCSFVNALETWLKDTDEETLAFIRDMKSRRSGFGHRDTDTILRYCLRECELLSELMTKLRYKMKPVKLVPTRWDGAGAIAGKLLQNHRVKEYRGTPDEAVAKASQFAYFGGRIEAVRYGLLDNVPVYSHDIRSAYPAAMVNLPCLAHGFWKHEPGRAITDDGAFRLVHVRYNFRDMRDIHPLPWRDFSGSVYFPLTGEGWYWQPEALLLEDFHRSRDFTVIESWTWHQTCKHQPFRFVEEVYVQRQRFRDKGHDAHIVLKLALNSIYGKLAQKVGWNLETKAPPNYHCLQWAGWITAATRAKLYRLAIQHPEQVVAFETDGLYSAVRHDCPEGTELGLWDVAEHEGIMYLQSGLYWLKDEGEWWSKSRGLQKAITSDYQDRALTRERVLKAWKRGEWEVPVIENRFRTMAAAVASPERFVQWRQWCDDPKTIMTIPRGKRCALTEDLDSGEWKRPGLHRTFAVGGSGMSTPHRLPWVDGLGDMIEELRLAREREESEELLEGL